MPLMVEPLVMKFVDGQKYGVNGNINEILPLVRQAVELGADVIKADPTSDIKDYHKGKQQPSDGDCSYVQHKHSS